MARQELGGVPIRVKEDVRSIKFPAERQFALLLLRIIAKKPHLRLSYERVMFTLETEDGKTLAALPDFHILNDETCIEHHIDVTCAERTKKDLKEKQERVMAANNEHVSILWRENLEKLQIRHPEYDLLKKRSKNAKS